jgi:predicted Zn-dependent protease
MNRRRWLAWGCAHCALLLGASRAQAQPGYEMPARFVRPDNSTDEGGLWALMDREEQRVRRSAFRIREHGLEAYLQGIVAQMAGPHAEDLRVYVLRTPHFNASMAPNGMIQVWTGLLLRMDNEAQLAAVLAHELGHYLQRHSVERLRDIKARSAFGTFMAMFGLVGAMVSLATLAGSFGFTREHETQADLIGMELMSLAGYDPNEASRVWINLTAELAANAAVDPQKNNPMLATHPNAVDRGQLLAEQAKGRTGRVDQAVLAAKLAPLRFDMLSDELKRMRHDETLVLLDRLLVPDPADAELLYFPRRNAPAAQPGRRRHAGGGRPAGLCSHRP